MHRLLVDVIVAALTRRRGREYDPLAGVATQGREQPFRFGFRYVLGHLSADHQIRAGPNEERELRIVRDVDNTGMVDRGRRKRGSNR